MNIYFSEQNDISTHFQLEVCDKDAPYISLAELKRRLNKGEAFAVRDPFTGQQHAVLGCTRHALAERAEARRLTLMVKGLETCRGGLGGCSSGQWMHAYPPVSADTCVCIAERGGLYRWRPAGERINKVAVVNRYGAIAFAHAEEKELLHLAPTSALFFYHLTIAGDAPFVLYDGRIRVIFADKAPESTAGSLPITFEGTRRFYLHPSLRHAPIGDLLRGGRTPSVGGTDEEARENFREVYEHLRRLRTPHRGGDTVKDAATAGEGQNFFCTMPHRRAALAVSAEGHVLAFAWDGKDVRSLNTLLVLAAVQTGRAVSCGGLRAFLRAEYAALGLDPQAARRTDALSADMLDILRHIRTAHTLDKVTVQELGGRFTAPCILLVARDGSYRTRITLREAPLAHVWELHHEQDDPEAGESYDCAVSSRYQSTAFRALAQWWAAVGESYACHYVEKHLIPAAETEGEMVAACIDFNQRFFRPHEGDTPLLREQAALLLPREEEM